MSKYTNNNLQLNDINNKLFTLEKKVSKIVNTLDFLTHKINDIHDDIFEIRPISSQQNKKITYEYSDNLDNSDIYTCNFPVLSPKMNNYSVKAVKAPTYHKSNKKYCLPDINRKYLY